LRRKDIPMTPIPWQPDRMLRSPPWPTPKLSTALSRGLLGRCPACGKTHIFNGYLRIVQECTNCHAPLGSARADDAPPYFVILITGHIVIPAMLIVHKWSDPSDFVLTAIFVPLSLVMALGLLRPVKGAVLAVMVSMGMLVSEPAPE
jgi:uncharacterized protein (DUF983 family)